MSNVLYLLSFFTSCALLVQLAVRGQYRTIPWFTTRHVTGSCLAAYGLVLGNDNPTYCMLFWSYLPVGLLLSILTSREIVSLICQQVKGLGWYWFDNLFLSGLASVLVALTVFPFTNRSRAACTWLQCGFAAFVETSAILNFAVFVFACTTVYLAFRFVPHMRPLKLHAALWAGMMFIHAYGQLAFILIRPSGGIEWVNAANNMAFIAAILLEALWIAILHRHTLLESTPVREVEAADRAAAHRAPVASFKEFVADLSENHEIRRRR